MINFFLNLNSLSSSSFLSPAFTGVCFMRNEDDRLMLSERKSVIGFWISFLLRQAIKSTLNLWSFGIINLWFVVDLNSLLRLVSWAWLDVKLECQETKKEKWRWQTNVEWKKVCHWFHENLVTIIFFFHSNSRISFLLSFFLNFIL